MKKVLLLATFIFSGVLAYAQNNSCDYLSQAYTATELNAMDAAEKDYLCFMATKGYYINDMTGKDLSGYADISTLQPRQGFAPLSGSSFDMNTFNLLQYQVELQEGNPLIYRIGNTGKVLFIQSESRMQMLYQRHQANNNSGQ